jgi:hypothetical protein
MVTRASTFTAPRSSWSRRTRSRSAASRRVAAVMVRRTRLPVAGSRPISRTASHLPSPARWKTAPRRDLADFPTPLPRNWRLPAYQGWPTGAAPPSLNLWTVMMAAGQRCGVRVAVGSVSTRRGPNGWLSAHTPSTSGSLHLHRRQMPASNEAAQAASRLAAAGTRLLRPFGALRVCGHTGGCAPVSTATELDPVQHLHLLS